MQGREDELGLTRERTPPEGTLERWAYDYVLSNSLSYKREPPSVPGESAALDETLRIERPGRPAELTVSWDKYKAPKSAHALRDAKKRAHLLHTFWHHELQAAELMCWAVLAFPGTPLAFRRGLLGICQDEIRHMRMYEEHIATLGFGIGSFAVRDWFWERAPAAQTPAEFVALMSLGFEAGNLDHSQRFTRMFEEAGDARGAELQRIVGEEEVAHVAFGAHWFAAFVGPLSFESWARTLPAPLSPMVMRGEPLERQRRARAGMDETFLNELEAWQPQSRGS